MNTIADSLAVDFQRKVNQEINKYERKVKALKTSKKLLKGNKEAISVLNQQIERYNYEAERLSDLHDGLEYKWQD